MTNHFHLLLQPEEGQNISRILQSLTVAHTWHYHKSQPTVGHVCQGRFKSPVIQDDQHLITVLRYVESNPLRARMVTDLASYPWSSYPVPGMGRLDPLITEVPGWPLLGSTEAARQQYWQQFVPTPMTTQDLGKVRQAVTTGRPFGSETWVETIADRLGISMDKPTRGSPKKTTGKIN